MKWSKIIEIMEICTRFLTMWVTEVVLNNVSTEGRVTNGGNNGDQWGKIGFNLDFWTIIDTSDTEGRVKLENDEW